MEKDSTRVLADKKYTVSLYDAKKKNRKEILASTEKRQKMKKAHGKKEIRKIVKVLIIHLIAI